jgi:hypothetical protein
VETVVTVPKDKDAFHNLRTSVKSADKTSFVSCGFFQTIYTVHCPFWTKHAGMRNLTDRFIRF